MKTPTQKEKIAMYENFLHDINIYIVSGRHDLVKQLVSNADNWSYAHRSGNGEISDKKQQERINNCFYKLRNTQNLI